METKIIRSGKPGLGRKIGWALMLLLAAFVTLLVSRYLTLDPEMYFPQQRATYLAHTAGLMLHIVGSMLALILGPFQFLPGIRKGRWLGVHRWLGRIYLLGILSGGLGGLYMAQFAYGGTISRLGFGALATLWLYSGWRAYSHIRRGEVERHREWMTRNYALTFAAVMLRLWLPVSGAAGIEFLSAYRAVAWLCWVPNLVVAEWIVRRNRPARQPAAVLTRTESPRTAGTEL